MGEKIISDKVVTAIRCQDIQTCLQGYSISEFETLLKIGMATRLALHIRGGPSIDYDRLKNLSPVLFDVDRIVFPAIIDLLAEIDFVTLLKEGKRTKAVIPKVPYFEDFYEVLGEKGELDGFNELEELSIRILHELSKAPRRRDSLLKELGAERRPFEKVLGIGDAGSYVSEVQRELGQDSILISPVYFSENPELFLQAVEKYGETTVNHVIGLIRKYPGWPFRKILNDQAIAGTSLTPDEVEIVKGMVHKGVVQPPSVTTTKSGKNYFIFTPPIGTRKIELIEKEVYEKAMAIITCVRQGEHFASWRVESPVALLKALLRDGRLRANTEAKEQYRTLAINKIVILKHKGGNWYETHLKDTPESKKALEIAIEMLESTELLTHRGVKEEYRHLLLSGEDYEEYLRGYGSIRKRRKLLMTPEEHDRLFKDIIDLAVKA